MAKHVIKSDRNGQWVIDADGDTWILKKQATLDVGNDDAVLIQSGFDSNKLVIDGDIFADVTAHAAIHNDGDGNSFTFGSKAKVVGEQGIVGIGDDTTVVNAGRIVASGVGIAQNEGFSLTNGGKVKGDDYGVSVAQADLIVNKQGGEIGGEIAGILLFGHGHSKIVNHGTISGGNYAIQDDENWTEIINKGRIEGHIFLGDGNDDLDTRQGTVTGFVFGGDGYDTYMTSRSNLKIVENVNEGIDVVVSTATFTLPDNVESLYLLGGKDIDGTGNELANSMTGNRGDNRLRGLDGDDRMSGGAGNDRLTGGGGFDTFRFNPDEDKEIVTDFDEINDRILIDSNITSIDTLSEVESRLEQHGSDVWLTAGGTMMVLKNVDVDDLGAGNFAFTVLI